MTKWPRPGVGAGALLLGALVGVSGWATTPRQVVQITSGSGAPVSVGPVLLPQVPMFPAAPSVQNIFSGSDPIGAGFVVPKDGILDGIEGYIQKDVNMSDFWVSFEDPSAGNGLADGTKDQFKLFTNANVTTGWNTFLGLTSDGTGGGTPRTVTKGQRLWVTFRYAGAGTAGQMGFRRGTLFDKWATVGGGLVYSYSVTSKSLTTGIHLALRYTDGTYGQVQGWYPFSAIGQALVNYAVPASNPQRGLIFTVAKAAEVRGFWLGTSAVATGGYQVLLLDSGDTVLATGAFNPIEAQTPNAGTGDYNVVIGEFPTTVTIPAGTYRMVINCTTGGCDVWELTFPSAALLGAMPGGTNWFGTNRVGTGAWTDVQTRRPIMGPVVSGF